MGNTRTTAREYYGYIVESIREMARNGERGIQVRQSKRYVDVDSISVDGSWYPVTLDTDMVDAVAVTVIRSNDFTCNQDELGVRWVDLIKGEVHEDGI